VPLFAPDEAAFEIALGDSSRHAVLGLLPQMSWAVGDPRSVEQLTRITTRESADILSRYSTIEAFAANADTDSNDLEELPELKRALLIATALAAQPDIPAHRSEIVPWTSQDLALAEAAWMRERHLMDLPALAGCAQYTPTPAR
jgi:hypothetical protein